ncbi:MAG TPA: hypothetical protein P5175_07370 [Anaerohalosphaeraceae bacterium]|nr:hypothetical protein [Phycisphaerae bacterium]HOK96721.1 hypothetical protein [Anaerohalosphaeraceae bacterium]HOM75969.1 hypothetical protein [Anaerohalosphaeraceae bacterium]HPC62989.1 hypothetical protein [Anaerohalosphaeraceae bacterium]HPO69460.1 hypothetical protein [Anaerohalosphaeraceae bacterium]
MATQTKKRPKTSKPASAVAAENIAGVTQIKKMTRQEIEQKALAVGVAPDTMDTTELIRAIQRAEGYSPCFGTSDGQCPYLDCCFRGNCL